MMYFNAISYLRNYVKIRIDFLVDRVYNKIIKILRRNLRMNSISYYRMRAFPNHVDRFSDFMEAGYVSIGWPKTGDVSNDSKEIISKKLSANYQDLTNRALGLTTGFFTRLLAMKRKDLILIPYENEIVVIAEVTEPYKFYPEFIESHTAHRVRIKKLKTLKVSDLPSDLKRSVDTIATVITLDKYAKEIDKLISSEAISVEKSNGLVFFSNNTEKNIILQVSENVTEEDLEEFFDKVKL